MQIWSLLYVAALACAANIRTRPLNKNASMSETRVVDGAVALQGEFPYMISLQRNSFFGRFHFCGGSLISADTIVTAAHCVHGLKSVAVWAVAGELQLENESGLEQEAQASEIIIHEGYDKSRQLNDVAIIKVDVPFQLNNNVNAIQLAESDTVLDSGSDVTVAGWGATREGEGVFNDLMKGSILTISNEYCQSVYGQSLAETMMCAGNGAGDSCQGDSGGPLVWNSDTLVGIVSWGFGCGRSGYPGVYSDVAYFHDWIAKHIT